MAPLSVLPGRIRFEASCLIANGGGCDLLERNILALQGVSEITSSPRTGRVLVRFDEGIVSRSEIEARLEQALRAVRELKDAAPEHSTSRRSSTARGESSQGIGHFVMEMALHAFLPAPLDLLLPAATALRR